MIATKTTTADAGHDAIELRGEGLTIDEVAAVARRGRTVRLTSDERVLERIEASKNFVLESVRAGDAVYGVTTGFGGMANVELSASEAGPLQENLIRFMTVGAGAFIPKEDVRAAMLLRANSHLRGVSGLRFEIISRIANFLNEDVTPQVREFGSIGASGDLAPLAQIMGAVCGISSHYQVDFNGETTDCLSALARLGLEPISPGPKEGLAMTNGTSVMTGIAANCAYDFRGLLALALGAHSMYIQALRGTNQSFHPFIHEQKPHPGQRKAAALMLELLDGSAMIRDELDGRHDHRGDEPIQDRYSLRCLPQYLGPVVDGLDVCWQQIEVEMNCANDNPLIDPDLGRSYHGGNFLGQYIGVSMDQLRYFLGLTAKHLDVQIALLMTPEFSNGLPPALVGNQERKINMGLKGLQISANSIMPLLTFLGNSLADRFPTHAEQFNQNINSQGFGSANLTRQAVETARQYFSIALLVAAQAVDLRTFEREGHYDSRETLSAATVPLYEAIHEVAHKPMTRNRPYVWDDRDQFLDQHIALIAEDLAAQGRILSAVEPWSRRLLELQS